MALLNYQRVMDSQVLVTSLSGNEAMAFHFPGASCAAHVAFGLLFASPPPLLVHEAWLTSHHT